MQANLKKYFLVLPAFFAATNAYAAEPACFDLHAFMAPLEQIRIGNRTHDDIIDHTVSVEIASTGGVRTPTPVFRRFVYTQAAQIVNMNYWEDPKHMGGFRNDMLTTSIDQDNAHHVLRFPFVNGEYAITACDADSVTAMIPDPMVMGALVETRIHKTSPSSFEIIRKFPVSMSIACQGMAGIPTESAIVTVTEERIWGPKAAKRARSADRLNNELVAAMNIPHFFAPCIEMYNVNGAQRVNSPAGIGPANPAASGAAN